MVLSGLYIIVILCVHIHSSSSSFHFPDSGFSSNADFVVFLSPSGLNTSSCGLSLSTACQTIAYAYAIEWEVGPTDIKTFQLGLGTYSETEGIIIKGKLKITGLSQTECIHTRTGNIDAFTLNTDGADLMLSNLTLLLIGTYNYIRSSHVNVTISVSLVNCRVRAAAQFGGPAIFFNNTLASLSFSGSKMYNMNISGEAFVWAAKMKELSVSDCSFANMYRTVNVGVIFHTDSTDNFTLMRSFFVQCRCANSGGVAQLFMAGPARIDSCIFWNTSALADHSGVAYLASSVLYNASVKVENSSFILCTANNRSGVFYFEQFVSPNYTRCTFTNCSTNTGTDSRHYGGALVHLQHGNMYVVRCIFRNCRSNRGGALIVDTTEMLVIQDSIFVENTGANGRDINYRAVTNVLIVRSFTDFAGTSGFAVLCNETGCTAPPLDSLVEGTVCDSLGVDELKPTCRQPCVLAPSAASTPPPLPSCTPFCPSTHVLVNGACVPLCTLWKAERNIDPHGADLYDCTLPCVHDTSLGPHLCAAAEDATVDDPVPDTRLNGNGRTHFLIYISPTGENTTTCGLSASSACLTLAYAYSADRNVSADTDTKTFQLLPGTYNETAGIIVKGKLNIIGQHQINCIHTRTGNFEPFTLNIAGADLFLTNLTLLLIGGNSYIRSASGVNVAVFIHLSACRIRSTGAIPGGMIGVDNTLATVVLSSCTMYSVNTTTYAAVTHSPRIGNVSILDSSFAAIPNSHYDSSGAVLHVENIGSVTIVRSLFVSCLASKLGGVFYLVVQGPGTGIGGGGGVFSGCVFWNCSSGDGGAGFLVSTIEFNATVLLSNCSFSRCTCVYSGGAIHAQNSVFVAVTRCSFTDCNTTHSNNCNGGALCQYSGAGLGTLRVTRCIFQNGYSLRGGAIYCDNIMQLTVVDTLFLGNKGVNGSDIHYYRNSLTIELTRAYTDGPSGNVFCNTSTNPMCVRATLLLLNTSNGDVCDGSGDADNNDSLSEDDLNPACPQPCVLSANVCELACATNMIRVHGVCVPKCTLWKAEWGEVQGGVGLVCDAPCKPDSVTLGIDLCFANCVSGYEPESSTSAGFSLVGGHCTLPSCGHRKPILPSAFTLGEVGLGFGTGIGADTGNENISISTTVVTSLPSSSTSLITTVLPSRPDLSSSSSSISFSALRAAISSSLSLTPLLHSSQRPSSPTSSSSLPISSSASASVSISTFTSFSTSAVPSLPLSLSPFLLLPNAVEGKPCGSNTDCFFLSSSGGGGSNGICTVMCPSFYAANRTTGLCTLISCTARTPDNPAAVAWPCGSDNCFFDVSSGTCVVTCPADTKVDTGWCVAPDCHESHYTTLNQHCVPKLCSQRVVNTSVQPYACGTRDCFFDGLEPPTVLEDQGGVVGVLCRTACATDNLHTGSPITGTSECALKECEDRKSNKSVAASACGELTCLYDEKNRLKPCGLTCSDPLDRDFGAGVCEEITCGRIVDTAECKSRSVDCHYRSSKDVCEEKKKYTTRVAIIVVVSIFASIGGIVIICCIVGCCVVICNECDCNCKACCRECCLECDRCWDSLTSTSTSTSTSKNTSLSPVRNTSPSTSMSTSPDRVTSTGAGTGTSTSPGAFTTATTTNERSTHRPLSPPPKIPPPPLPSNASSSSSTILDSSREREKERREREEEEKEREKEKEGERERKKKGKKRTERDRKYKRREEEEEEEEESESETSSLSFITPTVGLMPVEITPKKQVPIEPIDVKDESVRVDKRYGSYLLIDCIGEGAQGKVYKVKHERTGEIRALKIVTVTKKENAADAEIHIGTEFGKQCPYLVDYEEVTIRNSQYFILMEYCPGGDLRTQLNTRAKEQRPFKNKEIVMVLSQIGTALKTLHDGNVVHRDIKPENIFAGAVFKLGDYGTAKIIRSNLTKVTTATGTLEYMPPEIIQGGQTYGKDVDIYALGVVLLEMMALQHPFKPKGGLDIMAVTMGKYSLSPEVLERYTPELISLVGEMVSTDPSERPLISTILNAEFLKG